MPTTPQNTRRLLAAAAVIAFLLASQSTLPAAEVDRLFPPAVSVGGEATIKAEGKLPSWPAEIWCDRDDIECRPGEKSGEVIVSVKEDAPAGIAWLRFHGPKFGDKGASPAVPLLIEPLPVVVESDSNHEIETATPVEMPAAVVGRLEKSNDVDCFAVSLTKGETLVAALTAHRILGSPMDAVLQLVDGFGNVLVQADDVRGIDPLLTFTADRDGKYVVRLFAFPEVPTSTIGFAGGQDFVYRLHLTTGPLLDHTLPLAGAANDEQPAVATARFGWNLAENAELVAAPATAVSPPILSAKNLPGWHAKLPVEAAETHLVVGGDDVVEIDSLPAAVSGRIERPGDSVNVRFDAEAKTKYRARIVSQSLGLRLDSVLTATDVESGKQLGRNDDASSAQRDSSVDFTAASDGKVEITVADMVRGHGPDHAFTLLIDQVRPSAVLTFAEDRFLVKPGKDVEVAVKIDRRDGFDKPLEIAAVDLPEGLTCAPVVSEPKGDTAKEVKLKLTAGDKADYSGPIRLVGRPQSEGDSESDDTFPVTFPIREHFAADHLWLSVGP